MAPAPIRLLSRNRRGQVMTENILVVVLIAIALLAFVTLFGRKIARLFTAATVSIDTGAPVTDKAIMDASAAPEIGLGGVTNPGGGGGGGGGGGKGAGNGSTTNPDSGGGTGTSPTGTGTGGGGTTTVPKGGGGSSGSGDNSSSGTPTGPVTPGAEPKTEEAKKEEESKFSAGGSGEIKKEREFKNADGSTKFSKEGTKVWSKEEGWKDKEKKEESKGGKVEVGVEYTFHKKDRELKKYETETDEKYKERTDLAKGRAGVRFGTLDTKVTGNAKWDPKSGEVSVGGSAGVTVTGITAGAEGEVGNDYIKGKGGAEVVVGKVEAKADLKIGNSKTYAGAKLEAGIGASVVEGKLNGSVGSKWLGLEVEGELSGALLTAEAKGVAAAGYNKETKKFEVELGGKLGALIAGGGAKVKIKLSIPQWFPKSWGGK